MKITEGALTNGNHLPLTRNQVARLGSFSTMLVGLTVLVWHRVGASRLDTLLLNGYSPVPQRNTYQVAELLTLLGSPGVVVLFGIAVSTWVWFRTHDLERALLGILAPGGAGIAETLGKVIVHRTRPETAWMTGEGGVGFPSGHAAGFTAFALIATYLLTQDSAVTRRRMGFVVAIAAAFTMATTRVLVGAHYPTDVLAGLFVGAICAELSSVVAPYFALIFVSLQKRSLQKPRECRSVIHGWWRQTNPSTSFVVKCAQAARQPRS
jgi:membrane-associated phospholipid phosphatase